jgi:predicted PP-loop superfamily ATPase
MKPAEKDDYNYVWSFDTVMNAINDLEFDAINLNELAVGIKHDPERFVSEMLEVINKDIEERAEKEGRCLKCLTILVVRRVEEFRMDGFIKWGGESYCPTCDVAY